MTILDDIVAKKRLQLGVEMMQQNLRELQGQVQDCAPTRGFADAIRRCARAGKMGLIAEIKKGSPSKGLIREDFDPAEHAKDYEIGGAACLSVLTDTHFFGDNQHFTFARNSSKLPMLRKDFMIDPWQIWQSRVMGADCVLLIMAVLSDPQASSLFKTASACGLDVLLEVHNQVELERAMTLPATAMIGINNRNLHDFTTDLQTSVRLSKAIPPNRIVISESGITSPEDVALLRQAGAKGILVGEHLMRQADIRTATRDLLV